MKSKIFFTNRLRLNSKQLKALAEISRDIGQVFFAGLVIAPIATKEIDWVLFVLGLVASFVFWYNSLKLTRGFKL